MLFSAQHHKILLGFIEDIVSILLLSLGYKCQVNFNLKTTAQPTVVAVVKSFDLLNY
jgi:hypothetical protein